MTLVNIDNYLGHKIPIWKGKKLITNPSHWLKANKTGKVWKLMFYNI